MTRQIGEGAMGVVWAAVNESTGREVALKLILRSTEHLRLRLRREARSTGKMQHRNVIEILDMGETREGDPFLVMPLLTGETLRALMTRQGRLNPALAARIGRDVARALAVAHTAGIIHRDLKPANIFLHQEADADGPVVKVLDFGVSKDLNPIDGIATVGGGMVGSLAYMSPEQAKVDKTLDHRADIWSLGVILFEMLSGSRPFKGTAQDILPQLFFDDIPRLESVMPHVDPVLADLVSRCLERDQDKRIGSAAEIAGMLQRFAHPSQELAAVRASVPDAVTSPLPGMGGTIPMRAAQASRPEITPPAQAAQAAARNSPHGLPVAFNPDESDDSYAATVRLDENLSAALRRQPGQPLPLDSTVPLDAYHQGQMARAAGHLRPLPSPPPPANRASPAPSGPIAPHAAAPPPMGMAWPPPQGPMGQTGEPYPGSNEAAFNAGGTFKMAPQPSAPQLTSSAPPGAPTFDPVLISNSSHSAPPSRKQLGLALAVGLGVGVLGLIAIVLFASRSNTSPHETPSSSARTAETSAPSASPLK